MADVFTKERKTDGPKTDRQRRTEKKKEEETGRKKERKHKRSFSLRKKGRKKGMKTERTKKKPPGRQKEKRKKERNTDEKNEREKERHNYFSGPVGYYKKDLLTPAISSCRCFLVSAEKPSVGFGNQNHHNYQNHFHFAALNTRRLSI